MAVGRVQNNPNFHGQAHRRAAGRRDVDLRFGRVLAPEIEAPNLLGYPVIRVRVAAQSDNAAEPDANPGAADPGAQRGQVDPKLAVGLAAEPASAAPVGRSQQPDVELGRDGLLAVGRGVIRSFRRAALSSKP